MKHLVAGYYDDLKTTRMQQELSIGECVDDAVENSPEDCGFVIPEYMYSSEGVDVDNLVENILEHWNQNGYKTRIIKDIVQVVMDMNEDDIDDIKKFRTHLRNYVKTNFEAIARHVLELKFPNKGSIEKILKKHEPIEKNEKMLKRLRKVTLEAYENVKRWLAKEAPDLELEVMDEDDIRFGAGGNYGTTCNIDKKESLVALFLHIQALHETFHFTLIFFNFFWGQFHFFTMNVVFVIVFIYISQ